MQKSGDNKRMLTYRIIALVMAGLMLFGTIATVIAYLIG